MYIDLSTLNDGITQDKRRVEALMPDFIDVDERDIASLLKFMSELATQFNYYDVSNAVQGTWEDFFTSDIHVLLVIISRFDMVAHINQFSAYEDELYMAETDIKVFAALRNVFGFILNVLNMLNELQTRLLNVGNGGKMVDELSDIVAGFNSEALKLIRYNQQARKQFGDSLKIEDPKYFQNIESGPQVDDIFGDGTTVKDRVVNALPDLKKIFTDMGAKFNRLLGVTNFYLKNNDLLGEQYAPHLALCVAFLHLYRHLQQKLNETTKNHLDLYYKRILGLELKKEIPDTVHLIFEKDALAPHVKLNASEELLAQIPGQPDPVVFTLNKSLLVTNARIAELKTLYLAEHEQIENDEGIITEIQVYNGDYPCGTAAAYLKNKAPVKTWPVFGEDQDGLADEDITMDVSNIGVLLSSPVLYQPEGRRAISIYIHLDEESYDNIIEYFTNYSKVTKKELMAVSHQLLSDAFVIDYTDTKGWKEIQKYSASLNVGFRRLELKMQINDAEQFVDVYNPIIHGGSFDIEWPVFRLLLNNYSANNPFTFLRSLKMERITIIADVTGSKAVKLQNSVGPLSAASTSQLFGPQPSVGSYLDIKSSNIFNKYTQSFCIRLDWTDLPKETGGWESYYSAYNNKIVNSSFRIKLSTLTDGKFVPKVAQQQEFSLFETEYSGAIKSTTQLQDIDIKRLGFNKKPLLDKQDLLPDKNFPEGALRIELVAPKDAFGHRLFPQIFPEVVMYNAKHSKKLDLPNQPYAPLVRSLSVDYKLEHSEALTAGNTKSTDDSDLKMFHIYPFGYDEIYPGKRRAPYNLIPDFDQNNNLFIGLKNIRAGQVLSLLFQLEENNFTDLPETKTMWSYLDDNVWVNITEEDILLDATNNFINTGIIELKLPANLKTGNTILSPQLYWIRASAKNDVRSNIKGIYTQAAVATRFINDDVASTSLNMPAGCIKIFKRKVLGVQTITQPFQSFGGKLAETDEQYYIRVSERIRHGQKLLTSKDIELAILEQFPEILMAKCIDPLQYSPAYIEKYKPNLSVILIPREQANGVFISDEPKVNLSVRYQVQKFLQKSMPSFLNIDVKSPVYERLKIICTVKFKDTNTSDTGANIGKLNDDIKRYLCPWLYDQGSDFKIGTGIYVVELLNYIKKRPYIKYITDFSVVHFYFNDVSSGDEKKAQVKYTSNDGVYIKGSLPETVLIPNKTHLFTVTDEVIETKDRKIGISEFAIMDELLVDKDGSDDVLEDSEVNKNTQSETPRSFFNLVISHNLD
jgi:hypothetical protein